MRAPLRTEVFYPRPDGTLKAVPPPPALTLLPARGTFLLEAVLLEPRGAGSTADAPRGCWSSSRLLNNMLRR